MPICHAALIGNCKLKLAIFAKREIRQSNYHSFWGLTPKSDPEITKGLTCKFQNNLGFYSVFSVNNLSLFAGFDPGGGIVVQIDEGKVFGSAGFVRMWIGGMASRHKDAHEVVEIGSSETIGYSSHGWRLANAQRAERFLV